MPLKQSSADKWYNDYEKLRSEALSRRILIISTVSLLALGNMVLGLLIGLVALDASSSVDTTMTWIFIMGIANLLMTVRLVYLKEGK
jgi:hypothetical protein